jgi:pimeloyl-ACP methyl ester carboxylesterase
MKIKSGDIDLNVRDTGAGETALVFLHHWGGSSLTWEGVASRLRTDFRCIAIDARGAGDSQAPAVGFSTHDHATDALNVISALSLDRYILVGHSMGGKAAQLLASSRPSGLVGLVLVASSPLSPMAIGDAQRVQMKAAYQSEDAVEWTLSNVLLGSPVSAADRRQLIADALRLSPEARLGWIETGSREDLRAFAAKVEVPVTIVAGTLDRVDPIEVVKSHIVPSYPGAAAHFLADKGHLLPVEAPEAIANLISSSARWS